MFSHQKIYSVLPGLTTSNVLATPLKDTELVRPDLPHTVRVVLTLTEGLQRKGYDLYVDRFYTSLLLADEIMQQGRSLTGLQ